MPIFEHSIEIKADREALFDLTQDYSTRLSWDPFLIEARLVGNAATPEVGVRAWCVAKNGMGMETEYVSFKRPEVTAVKMTKGPAIFRLFAGSWRFEQLEPSQTRVIFRYNFSLRPRWLAFMVNPFVGFRLSRETKKRLICLKQTAETGAGA